MKTFDTRISILEIKTSTGVPGTIITRSFTPASGMQWTIGFGNMNMPKQFFIGNTIEEALSLAERTLL